VTATRELALAHLHHAACRHAQLQALVADHRTVDAHATLVHQAQGLAGGRRQAGLLEQRADGQRRAGQATSGMSSGTPPAGPVAESRRARRQPPPRCGSAW
jgi:hypothetical protein